MGNRKAGRGPQRISISIEKLEPLTGKANADTGQELPFEGWLELLNVLSRLTESDGDPGLEFEQDRHDGT